MNSVSLGYPCGCTWASAPVGKQHEQVEDADGAVAVEISGAALGRIRTRPPTAQQDQQIKYANHSIAVEVAGRFPYHGFASDHERRAEEVVSLRADGRDEEVECAIAVEIAERDRIDAEEEIIFSRGELANERTVGAG